MRDTAARTVPQIKGGDQYPGSPELLGRELGVFHLGLAVAQLRVNTDLEYRDKATGRLSERLSWERHEDTEEGLQALEGLGNPIIVRG